MRQESWIFAFPLSGNSVVNSTVLSMGPGNSRDEGSLRSGCLGASHLIIVGPVQPYKKARSVFLGLSQF